MSQSSSGIRDTPLRLGAISESSIELFWPRTRDRAEVPVYRDRQSKVIFIDGHYVGDEEYASGAYRNVPKPSMPTANASFEDWADSERRLATYGQFLVGRSIVDFGCGSGGFLRRARGIATSAVGVELQQDFMRALCNDGIPCVRDISEVAAGQDTLFMFHCLEHLPDPIAALRSARQKLKTGGAGKIIVEVPHARDFLIDKLALKPFIDFTLWSQHLILHTRESLGLMLEDAGFRDVCIEGVQRYSIANHSIG